MDLMVSIQQQMAQFIYGIVSYTWWLIIMPALCLTAKFLEDEYLNTNTVDCLSNSNLNKGKLIKCISVRFIKLLLCQVFNLFMFYVVIVRILGLSWLYTISYMIIVSLIWFAMMLQSLMLGQSKYIESIDKKNNCMKENLYSAIWRDVEVDNSTLWRRLKNIWNNVSTEQIEFNFYEDKEIFNLFIEKVMFYVHKMSKSDLFPAMFANSVFDILKDLNDLYNVMTKDEFKDKIKNTSVIVERMYKVIEQSELKISKDTTQYENSLKRQITEKQEIIKNKKSQNYDEKLRAANEFVSYYE